MSEDSHVDIWKKRQRQREQSKYKSFEAGASLECLRNRKESGITRTRGGGVMGDKEEEIARGLIIIRTK